MLPFIAYFYYILYCVSPPLALLPYWWLYCTGNPLCTIICISALVDILHGDLFLNVVLIVRFTIPAKTFPMIRYPFRRYIFVSLLTFSERSIESYESYEVPRSSTTVKVRHRDLLLFKNIRNREVVSCTFHVLSNVNGNRRMNRFDRTWTLFCKVRILCIDFATR